MSTEARAVHFPAADWDGGVHPYRVGHRKLGMWLFIVSDSLTFSALLMGYAYLRASNVWPTPFPFKPSILFASLMTFCLLSSSLTMVFAVSASSRGDKAKARKWIFGTIFFGVAFLVLHLIEWNHLIHDGLRPFSLPADWVAAFTTTDGKLPSPLFGATFFAITGLHMFHVFTGAVYLSVVAARVNKLKHEDVEISGLYWHFVDLVWMFVFPLIYILSVDVGGHLAK
ncbi:MAG TPA: cytochrome c oxidase subunit 3 [Pyrinomonadaceae bacterium]|nr:cytochrome c oxidase subunit 3 [Pyrinomonadaceae bacterium]